MAKLDSLIVDLQLNTAALKKGLDDATSKLESFGKKIDKIGSVVSFTAFANITKQVVTGLTNFVMAGAQAADQTGKLAQSAGVSAESFSRLQYAARLSGLTGDELGAAMGRLNKNLAEAGAGAREQTALFNALGIKVTDAAGNVRGADAVMGDLAERFANMKDGASKGALAAEVFGDKIGPRLIPFLNQGRDGLAQLAAECDRLGVTITDAAAKGAEEFNDNLEKLEMAAQGVAAQVAANLSPALAALTGHLLNSTDAANVMKGTVETITTLIRVLASMAIGTAAGFRYLGVEIAQAMSAVIDAVSGNAEGMKANWAARNKELANISKETKAQLAAIFGEGDKPIGPVFDRAALAAERSGDRVFRAAKRGAKGLDEQAQAVKSLEKTLADLQAKSESFGAGPLEEFEARLRTGDLAQLLDKAGAKADELREKLRAAFEELHIKELKQIVDKIDADKERSKRSTGHDVSDRRLAMDQVGASPREKAEMATSGFASFDHALDELASNTAKQTEALGRAALLRAEGDEATARSLEDSAEQYARLADQAGKAADGFQDLAEIELQEAVAGVDRFVSAIGTFVGQMMGKLGDFGSVVNAGIQGFQQGGWWGALAGVIIELVSHFERFQEVIDIANMVLFDFIDALGPGLNALVDGLDGLMQGLDGLLNVVGSLLNPVLRGIGIMLEHVGRTLEGVFGGGLGSAMESFGGILDAFMEMASILDPMKPIIKLLSALFGVIGVGLMKLNEGIMIAMAWIFQFLRDLLTTVGLDDMAMAMGNLEIKMRQGADKAGKTAAAQWEKLGHTFDDFFDEPAGGPIDTGITTGVEGVKDLGEAADKTAKSMSKLTEQFTNIPEGFRMSLARYESMDPVGGGFGGKKGGPFGGDTYHFHIAGSLLSEQSLMDMIARWQSKRDFRKYGKGKGG